MRSVFSHVFAVHSVLGKRKDWIGVRPVFAGLPPGTGLGLPGTQSMIKLVGTQRAGYWLVTAATIRCTMPSIAAP